jgi:hypothetical protein
MKGHRGSDPDYRTFPDVKERIGEDPARFLSPKTDRDPAPRIRGITDRETAAAWLAVCRQLGCSRRIERALEERVDALTPEQPESSGGEPANV